MLVFSYLGSVAEKHYLLFLRKRESIVLHGKAALVAMDPRFCGGDSFLRDGAMFFYLNVPMIRLRISKVI